MIFQVWEISYSLVRANLVRVEWMLNVNECNFKLSYSNGNFEFAHDSWISHKPARTFSSHDIIFSSFCSSFVRPRRVQNHKHLWDERKFKFQLREKTTNSLMSWIGNLVDAKSDSMWVVSLFSFSPDLNNENFLCKLNFFLYCCMLLRYSDDDNLGHELCEGNRNFVKFMFSHVNKMSRRDWRHDEESECIEFSFFASSHGGKFYLISIYHISQILFSSLEWKIYRNIEIIFSNHSKFHENKPLHSNSHHINFDISLHLSLRLFHDYWTQTTQKPNQSVCKCLQRETFPISYRHSHVNWQS